MMQSNFTLIINLITNKSVERTISILEEEQIYIIPNSDLVIYDPNFLGAGLCLHIKHDQQVDAIGGFIDRILSRYSVKYLSICVIDTMNNQVSWTYSNIKVVAVKTKSEKAKKVSYLRLVPKPEPTTPEEIA